MKSKKISTPDLSEYGIPPMGTRYKGFYFDTEAHRYYLDGRELPSVSKILGACGFYNHYSAMPEAKRQAALEMGKLVHNEIEKHLLNPDHVTRHDRQLPEVIDQTNQFLRWATMRKLEVIALETPVFNNTWGYAGTFDIFGSVEIESTRELALIEIKTGGVEPWHAVQLAAYSKCLTMPVWKISVGLSPKFEDAQEKIYTTGHRSSVDWAYTVAYYHVRQRYGIREKQQATAQADKDDPTNDPTNFL